MSNPIEIIGGMASPSTVSISSSTYSATARYRDGEITTEVVKVTAFNKWWLENRHWYIPRTVRLVAFIWMNTSWRTKLGSVIFIVTASYLVKFISPSADQQGFTNAYLILTLFALMIIFIWLKIARWHSAEHMTCAAYYEEQSSELNCIRRQNRVSVHCGSRFTPWLILSNTFYFFIPHNYAVGVVILFMEAILFIDGFVLVSKIPAISWVALGFQGIFLTRPAQDIHLRVGQAALLALLEKHADEE